MLAEKTRVITTVFQIQYTNSYHLYIYGEKDREEIEAYLTSQIRCDVMRSSETRYTANNHNIIKECQM